jgi:hypothetical protein
MLVWGVTGKGAYADVSGDYSMGFECLDLDGIA